MEKQARETEGQRLSESGRDATYRVRSVFGAGKMNHAIDAGKGGASAAVAMRVELLLGENVTARLMEPARQQVRGCGNSESNWARC